MSDKILNPLLSLVDRGKPELAAQQACLEVDALLNFLTGLYQSGRLEDEDGSALKYAGLALLTNKTAKNFANFIFLLTKAGRHDEVWPVFSDYKPGKDTPEDVATLYYNYACALMEAGSLKKAAEAFREARRLNPECAMTRYQLSNVLMALGEYKEGLEEDQWRFKAHSQLGRFRKRFNAPDWDKSRQERVLVFSEQGLGDAIHCARYLKDLKDTGCRVILEIQSELADLFKGHRWVDEVHARESTDYASRVVPDEVYDSVVSINSLPYHFDPELNSPAAGKYLDPWPKIYGFKTPEKHSFSMNAEGHWNHIDYDLQTMRVGLVWAGSKYHSNDKHRSCYLKHLAPLFHMPHVQLLNFQHGDMIRTWCRGNSTLWDGDENYDVVDLNEGAEALLEKMIDPIKDCETFFETALVLKQLDLLITVDTALAHLAGAMGVPTWLMLPQAHEWRWRRPWYTSVTYYKQDKPGDWAGLVKRISEDLRQKSLDWISGI